jgi:hypothetical protein
MKIIIIALIAIAVVLSFMIFILDIIMKKINILIMLSAKFNIQR